LDLVTFLIHASSSKHICFVIVIYTFAALPFYCGLWKKQIKKLVFISDMAMMVTGLQKINEVAW
jgi:hypothetical protein